jgi:phosphatidylinositol-3-phosphatase
MAIGATIALRRALIGTLGIAAVSASTRPERPRDRHAPLIRHVFILVLENESFVTTFGSHSRAPYLADTLVSHGALLRGYYGIGHASLDNYIAMISGQAPNEATQLDCPIFTEFQLTRRTLDANGQAIGTGCVYPRTVNAIGDELESAGFTWKGYMEDLGNDPAKESSACGHPKIGTTDSTVVRHPSDQYATKHNPFYYFHSLIDDPSRCTSHVVNLKQLKEDLASPSTTPNYVFITPNLCNDGHDAPCVDSAPGGLVQADRFLRTWVPVITNAPAFREDGILIITFDEAGGALPGVNAACCGERGLAGQHHPPGWTGPGGGRVGAVILSPFVHPGTVSDVRYNHYSLLRWVEDQYNVPHLGYAAGPHLTTFGTDVFGETIAATGGASR